MDILQSIYDKLATISLGQSKDILAYADDRDSALVIAQNIRDEIEAFDHVDTGRMINSIKATKRGSQHVVTGVTYTKYVNGYDREKDGQGFVDVAVDQAILDGYDGETAI